MSGRALLFLFALGCDGAAPAADSFAQQPLAVARSDAGTITAELRTTPEQPPVRGVTTAEISLVDAAGAPVTGAQITATPWMVEHAHGTSTQPTLAEEGGGRYLVRDIDLFMPGHWQLRFEVAAPHADVFVFDLEVH